MLQSLRISGLFLGMVLAGCGTTSTDPTDPAPTDPSPTNCVYEGGSLPSLEVAAGQACSLSGTTVRGNITLASGARLKAFLGAAVGGDVQGQGAANVTLDGVTVSGNVQLGGGGTVDITDSSVEGQVQLTGHSGPLGISDTFVGGNLQLLQNIGGVFVDYNVVTGDLQCEENSPVPEGAENTVSGNKSGQCSDL